MMQWPPQAGAGSTPTGTGFVHVTSGVQDGSAAPVTWSDCDSSLVASTDSRLSDSRTPTGSAGGALGGTFPNPSCTGRFLGRTVKTSGSGTFTTQARTNTIKVTLLGGGGAGGGAATASSSGAAGGGGASGGYAEKVFAVSPSTGYSYAVGTGGTAGSAGNNPGNAGGNSTFTVGATTVTANGGLGGQGMAAAATVTWALGGAAPSVSTNGDVNATGAPGGPGARNTAALLCAGEGGSSPYGGAGNARTTQGAGNSATGFGSGGGGGACISNGGAVAGGTGSGGLIVIDEYE